MSSRRPTPVEIRQNEPDMLRLQRAASRAHVSAQRWSRTRWSVAVAFAVAALVTKTVVSFNDLVVVLGLTWLVLQVVYVTPTLNSVTTRSALLQERFDTQLLELPWNDVLVGPPLREDEVQEWARKFGSLRKKLRNRRESNIRDWYDVEGRGVPWPYDVLLCQRQNLAWDAKLRRGWAITLGGLVLAWGFVGVGASAGTGTSTLDALLRFFAPSVPAIQLAVSGAFAHRRIASDRERAATLVERELNTVGEQVGLTDEHRQAAFVRQVQDVLWRTRTESVRVPQWFYLLSRSGYTDDFRVLSDEARRNLGLISPGDIS